MPHDETMREKLILAGIGEIERRGIQNFSLRQVATACGVSCAAPYKHFTDKNDLILSIILYINQQWYAKQSAIIAPYAGDPRRQLIEVSMAYVQFLLDNPHFRSIIMLRDDSMSELARRTKSQLSACTARLVAEYCAKVSMPPDVRRRKTYAVRSFIYGAALMLDNGELPDTPEVMEGIRYTITREFDLG
ncbi:MAG: TetR/AcrR family transcriptional regulator [Candidatus Pelethousia sp.]|nr:TetR/AcrR family transcriptional regulator [Candidatus Pelethousia sp.]